MEMYRLHFETGLLSERLSEIADETWHPIELSAAQEALLEGLIELRRVRDPGGHLITLAKLTQRGANIKGFFMQFMDQSCMGTQGMAIEERTWRWISDTGMSAQRTISALRELGRLGSFYVESFPCGNEAWRVRLHKLELGLRKISVSCAWYDHAPQPASWVSEHLGISLDAAQVWVGFDSDEFRRSCVGRHHVELVVWGS